MATTRGSYDFKSAVEAHNDAEKKATNYIMTHTDNASYFHAEDNNFNPATGDAVKITDQIDIIRGGSSVMSIGETNSITGNDVVRIGKSGETRAEIDYHSLKLLDANGTAYFSACDIRNEDGYVTEYFPTGKFVNGQWVIFTKYTPTYGLAYIRSVKLDGVSVSYRGTTGAHGNVELVDTPASGESTLTIEYDPWQNIDILKYYTIGTRDSDGKIGPMSVVEGQSNIASAVCSHAEGMLTKSSGMYTHSEGLYSIASGEGSHSEGYSCEATGEYSHAEGYDSTASGARSHAEGHATASGEYSHAEGYSNASGAYAHSEGMSGASGDYSHSQNRAAAASEDQTALGKYNITDSNGTYSVIIGNGASYDSRANMLTIDWSGNIVTTGKATVGSAPTANMDVATKKYVDDSIPTVPTNVSSFTNDAGYITSSSIPASTATPTASTIAKFDSSAKMNSTDMTTGSGGEIETFVDSLTFTGITAVDYPIEQEFGVNSTGWSYTKWNSGKLECWYTGNPGSYTCGTARGNMYAGGWLTMTYPISFLTTTSPAVTASVTLTTDAYCVFAQLSQPTESSVKLRITSSGSISANSNYNVKLYAIGRWK